MDFLVRLDILKVAPLTATEVPITVPTNWKKDLSQNLKMLFFVIFHITEMTVTKTISRGVVFYS